MSDKNKRKIINDLWYRKVTSMDKRESLLLRVCDKELLDRFVVGKLLFCRKCLYRTKSKGAMTRHVRSAHPVEDADTVVLRPEDMRVNPLDLMGELTESYLSGIGLDERARAQLRMILENAGEKIHGIAIVSALLAAKRLEKFTRISQKMEKQFLEDEERWESFSNWEFMSALQFVKAERNSSEETMMRLLEMSSSDVIRQFNLTVVQQNNGSIPDDPRERERLRSELRSMLQKALPRDKRKATDSA